MADTDDAVVTTDLVRITPQPSGQIVELPIQDNQFVHKGDLLLAVDPQPFQSQVYRHQAALDAAQAKLVWLTSQVDHSKANVSKARAALNNARYNLPQTRMSAPLSGFVTALKVKPGDYAGEGDPGTDPLSFSIAITLFDACCKFAIVSSLL